MSRYTVHTRRRGLVCDALIFDGAILVMEVNNMFTRRGALAEGQQVAERLALGWTPDELVRESQMSKEGW